ncbi:MAG: hypothetical protein LBH43_17125 [Treponema sp.]|jgi:hypothetical protein|nr:hypothetical protein [Treponema sp.]
MIEFARSIFRGFFIFTLWVFLILFAIGGGILGHTLSWGSGGYTFLGVIIGLFLWFCFYILGGGLLATFLNMDENLEILAKNVSKLGNNPSIPQGGNVGSSVSIVGNKRQKKCKRCHKEIDEDYSGCPHCGNNTFE